MSLTPQEYKRFNVVGLSSLAKLQPVVDAALHNSSVTVKNFVDENMDLLATEKGFNKFMNGIEGTKLHEMLDNIVSVSVQNSVKELSPVTDGILSASDTNKLLGEINSQGLTTIVNSVEDNEEVSEKTSNMVRMINSYEASEDGTFGLNRIMTTLSLRLAQVTRAEILRTGIEKYINVSTGQCGFKKELLRLGVQGQYPTPEEMAGAVGNIDFENTGSIEINQTSIPVIQFSTTVRWNRINQVLNQAINLSLVDELITVANTAFEVALERVVQYGVISKRDNSRIKGLLNYPDAVANNSIWTVQLSTNAEVEAFADKIVEAWAVNSQVNEEDADAIIRPFTKLVMPRSISKELQKVMVTAADFPVNRYKTVKEYFKDVIEMKLSDMTDSDVSVTILTTAFGKGSFLEKKTGEVGAKDRMLAYNDEGSIFDYTRVAPFGFNTADNVTFQNRMVMFASQPELKFKEKDILIVAKGY